MKRIFINGIFAVAGLLMAPAIFAQDKPEKNKDVQQIIITRSGDIDVKTVIEIKGDKVVVNGKDVKGNADSDVKVRVNKIRDVTAFNDNFGPGNFNFNFDGNNARALFSEDANRPMLGIVTEESSKGAKINSVSKESGAEKAGLKKGDIITKVNETKITTAGDVTTAIRKHKPGDKVTVTFLRDEKEQKATAELSKWKGIRVGPNSFNLPRVDIAPFAANPPYGMGGAPKLGLSVQDTEDGKGVKVLEVDEDSNAGKAGVKENDIITHVNNEAVNTADEIARKIRSERNNSSFQLKLLRNGKVQDIEVKTPRKLRTADL